MSRRIFQVITHCNRLTAIKSHMENGQDVIFVSVFVPYNDNSVDYFDEFEVVVGSMQGLVDKYIGCKFDFGGDYNISKTSNDRTANTLDGFCLPR